MIKKEKLFEKAVENVDKMMSDREYLPVIDDRQPKFENDVYYQKSFFKGEENLEVFFIGDFKTDKSFLDSIETLCSNLDTRHLIFIFDSEKKMDSFPKNFSIKKITAEFFPLSFFYHGLENPFDQTYKPATDEEVRELIDNYSHVSKFPQLSKTDRVSRWFNFGPGDVLKIIRPSISIPYVMDGEKKICLYIPEFVKIV